VFATDGALSLGRAALTDAPSEKTKETELQKNQNRPTHYTIKNTREVRAIV